MPPNQNTSIPEKDENTSENIRLYEDEESTLEEKDIKRDLENLKGKNLDIRSHIRDGLSGYTSEDGVLVIELSLYLKKVRFSK